MNDLHFSNIINNLFTNTCTCAYMQQLTKFWMNFQISQVVKINPFKIVTTLHWQSHDYSKCVNWEIKVAKWKLMTHPVTLALLVSDIMLLIGIINFQQIPSRCSAILLSINPFLFQRTKLVTRWAVEKPTRRASNWS